MASSAPVDDELDMERLFTETVEAFGAIDAVVHAVRGRVIAAPLTEIAVSDFDALLRTNIRATFIVNRMADVKFAMVALSRKPIALPFRARPALFRHGGQG
jgi:NAD(P)-dependent dehydrogenase (short-subunit alcohol dehydrogenase family)